MFQACVVMSIYAVVCAQASSMVLAIRLLESPVIANAELDPPRKRKRKHLEAVLGLFAISVAFFVFVRVLVERYRPLTDSELPYENTFVTLSWGFSVMGSLGMAFILTFLLALEIVKLAKSSQAARLRVVLLAGLFAIASYACCYILFPVSRGLIPEYFDDDKSVADYLEE